MKKLKLRLDALREEMEILDFEELKGIKGGGEGGYYGYDSWEDFIAAIENGDVEAGVYYPDGGYGEDGGYGYQVGGYGDPWGPWGDGDGGYSEYGGYGEYWTSDGYWSWIDSDYTYTAIGSTLDEVVIQGTPTTFLLSTTTEIFSLGNLGDKLTITNYSGITTAPAGYVGYEAVFNQDGQIGDTYNLGLLGITYLHSGGLQISAKNAMGVSVNVALSLDGATGGFSYTSSDGNIIGTEATFRPGAATFLVVVGAALCYVTGGTAIPILSLAL